MNSKSRFEYDRMYVALVTPYKVGSEDIDEAAFRSLIKYWATPKFINAGGAIIISPEAGEVFYTTIKEKVRLAEIALEEAGNKTLIVTGAMQPATRGLIEEVKALKKTGVHGFFMAPPMGAMDVTAMWDPRKRPGVYIDWLRAVADASGNLPIITHPPGGGSPACRPK